MTAETEWRAEVEGWRWRVMWSSVDGAGTDATEYIGTAGLVAAHAEVVRLDAASRAAGDTWRHRFFVVHASRSDWRLYPEDLDLLARWVTY